MKLWAAVLTAFLGVVSVVPAFSQVKEVKEPNTVGEPFQVRRNVLLTDPVGAKVAEQRAEDVKLFEDGVEQQVTGLTENRGPLYLQIVVDDSGSMATVPAVTAAVAKFIVKNVEPGTQVQFIRFGQGIGVTTAWTSDTAMLEKAIDAAPRPCGNSPIYDGILMAMDQAKTVREQAGEKRFAVVLISDTVENSSRVSLPMLLDELRRSEVPVFTVLLSDAVLRVAANPRYAEMMQQMERFAHDAALASGGSAYFPLGLTDVKRPIQESLKPLANELKAQYVVTYIPTNLRRDGKERSLRVVPVETGAFDEIKRSIILKQTYVVPFMKQPWYGN